MRERPILFSGEMVRAILDGRKSQTRRLVVGPKRHGGGDVQWADRGDVGLHSPAPEENAPRVFGALFRNSSTGADRLIACPYGQPGDRLWVRETWRNTSDRTGEPSHPPYEYAVDYQGVRNIGRWRPSIHMPRAASRITLEVTGARVERVQDISEDDAIAEGIDRDDSVFAPRTAFSVLWQELNGGRGYGWDRNPWVWVIEFRRVDEQLAEVAA